jgi:hypothetical protein
VGGSGGTRLGGGRNLHHVDPDRTRRVTVTRSLKKLSAMLTTDDSIGC